MSSTLVLPGSTEPIATATIIDDNGDPITGLTDIELSVRRVVSGTTEWLDFSDMTFRAVPTQHLAAMTQVSATRAPGVYEYLLNFANVTNIVLADRLRVEIQQTTLTSAANARQSGELIYGYTQEIKSGLALTTDVTAAVVAIDGHTDGAIAPVQAGVDAIKGAGFTGGEDDLHSARALLATKAATGAQMALVDSAITSAKVATDAIDAAQVSDAAAAKIRGTLATAQNVLDAVTSTLAGIAAAHGAGSYLTASTAGLATAQNVLDAVVLIEAYGQLHWQTATMVALNDGALTDAKIGANFVSTIISGLATTTQLDTHAAAIKGAGFDTALHSLAALRARGDAAWVTANISALATTAQLDAHAAAIKGAGFVSGTDDLHSLRSLVASVPSVNDIWTPDISGNENLDTPAGILVALTDLGLGRQAEAEGNPGSLLVYRRVADTLRFSFELRDKDNQAVAGSSGEPAKRSAAVVT